MKNYKFLNSIFFILFLSLFIVTKLLFIFNSFPFNPISLFVLLGVDRKNEFLTWFELVSLNVETCLYFKSIIWDLFKRIFNSHRCRYKTKPTKQYILFC